jgi:squalene-hopene/tetraprenyl-beta-curcumene cyclase
MKYRERVTWGIRAVLCGMWLSVQAASSALAAGPVGPDPKLYQTTVDRAIRFLASQQAPDGSVSGQMGIGATALTTLGLMRQGRGVNDPQVAKGLAYLEQFVQESGGIHAPGTFISNYETCVAVVCLQQANANQRYDKTIAKAEAFVRGVQWGEAKGKQKSDVFYGGSGYGGRSRPDLSNTAFLIETLKACGAGPNDPAIQKALVFVSRCQNLESEHNTTPFAAKINDGGFYYTCAVDQQGKSGETAEGGLRSYGSMGYSGLKSMIYAGLTQDDPRVKAAVAWIRKHYDVKSNPGQGDAGLFYYYHTFAKALDALGQDTIEDAAGVKHDWRRELAEELARRQRPDGSWVNTNIRWGEGDANLVTAFGVLALSYCRPK